MVWSDWSLEICLKFFVFARSCRRRYVDNLNFPPRNNQNKVSKIFKSSVSFKYSLSKVEQKLKFNPRVRQNGQKKFQFKEKSAFFKQKYSSKYEFDRKINQYLVYCDKKTIRRPRCWTKVRFLWSRGWNRLKIREIFETKF